MFLHKSKLKVGTIAQIRAKLLHNYTTKRLTVIVKVAFVASPVTEWVVGESRIWQIVGIVSCMEIRVADRRCSVIRISVIMWRVVVNQRILWFVALRPTVVTIYVRYGRRAAHLNTIITQLLFTNKILEC
jgi:hypothetical protein